MGFCQCGCGGEVSPVPAQARALREEGLTYREIGEQLGLTAARIHRAVASGPARFISGHVLRQSDEVMRARLREETGRNGECWEWAASVGSHGYGQVNFQGRQRTTHTLSYELFHGPIPAGMEVCHRCDNRRCVNPDHLFAGTRSDNVRDMVAKRRHWQVLNPDDIRRGAAHHKAKLSEVQVLEIRSLGDQGWVQLDIARAYGLSGSQVHDIVKRKSWRHLAEVA